MKGQFLTVTQVVELTQLTRPTIYAAIHRGDLECYRISPRAYRISREQLDRWLQSISTAQEHG